MISNFIAQSALGLAFAACLAAAYKLGEFVAERRHAFQAAEEKRKASAWNPPPGRPAWISSLQPQQGSAGFVIASALNGLGPLGRSRADEPVFVLCARDKAASMAVRDWAALAEKIGAKPDKVWGARALADHMEQWRDNNGGGKIPD